MIYDEIHINQLDTALDALEGARFSCISDIVIFRSLANTIVKQLFEKEQISWDIETLIKDKATVTVRILLKAHQSSYWLLGAGYKNTAKYTRDFKIYGRGKRVRSFRPYIHPEKFRDAVKEAMFYISAKIHHDTFRQFETLGEFFTQEQRRIIDQVQVLLWNQFSYHTVAMEIIELMGEVYTNWYKMTKPEIPVFLNTVGYNALYEDRSPHITKKPEEPKKEIKQEQKDNEKYCWNCMFWCCKRNQAGNAVHEAFKKSTHRCPIKGRLISGECVCGNWKKVK